VRAPVALEVAHERRAEVAEGLLARVQRRHVRAKDVDRLLAEAQGAPVGPRIDEARARERLHAPRDRGVDLAGLDDLVAQKVAVGGAGLELAARQDRLARDAIADRARQPQVRGTGDDPLLARGQVEATAALGDDVG
jgi:hypothetical protein